MKLQFENNKGQYLCGIWSGPTHIRDRPVVIMSHGLASSKDRESYCKLESSLNKENIATFRFDFSGHGDSEGKFEDFTLSQAVEDIHSAVEFLTETDLKYSKVGLFGASFGGVASIIATSQSEKINFLASKSPFPPYNRTDWKFRAGMALKLLLGKGSFEYRPGRRLNYNFLRDIKQHDSHSAAEKINIPTFIVHGSEDKMAPIANSYRLHYLLGENGLIQTIEGADHGYSNPEHFDKMMKGIVGFISENCK